MGHMSFVIFVARVQVVVGLCVPAVVWWSLPTIHPMGRKGQTCVQSRGPKRTGTSLGKPQGEYHSVWASVHRNKPAIMDKKNFKNSTFQVLNIQSHITAQRKYDLWKDVPCFAALLQAEHHQERAWTKTALQVWVLFCSFSACICTTIPHTHTISAFLWRFLKLPKKKNLLTDHSKIAEDTQDEDLEDPGSPSDLSEDHFEVSPDRASPDPPS